MPLIEQAQRAGGLFASCTAVTDELKTQRCQAKQNQSHCANVTAFNLSRLPEVLEQKFDMSSR